VCMSPGTYLVAFCANVIVYKQLLLEQAFRKSL
jgi:hypothetical protein